MLQDALGAGILLAYYLLVCVLVPTLLRIYFGVPRETVRKLQHIAYSLSIFLLLHLFNTWYMAVAASLLLVLLAYPALQVLEKLPWYRKTFVDRSGSGGELRRQLLYVQASFAILLVVFWGLLGAPWQYVVALAVMAWGFGDAAAALVGKAWGRRRIIHRWVDSVKTREGTLAMMGAAGLALFFTAWLYMGQSWYVSLLLAVLSAPICALIELVSRRGTDTLTVPLFAAALLVPLVYLFSYLGW